MADNHHHNHSEDGPFLEQDQLDAAGKSLADALRASFFVLKLIMVVLVILFLTSGIFRVQEDENALVLRYGKIRGAVSEARILKPGLHWAWPEPISEIVTIPVTKVQVVAIDSFWYSETPAEKLSKTKGRGGKMLNPVIDGYCLTRNESMAGAGGSDYNIVHAKWELKYRINRPEKFFKNIYYQAPSPGQDFLDVAAETVNPLLKTLVSDATVTTMVNYSIDEAIVSKSEIAEDVKILLQEKLDRIDSGITVVAMQVSGKITWPRQVDDEFQRLINARQKSDEAIISAEGYAEQLLSEAGGGDAEEILEALKKPGLSRKEKEKLFDRLAGISQETIAIARAERTEVVETARANADYLIKLLPQYRKRPMLVLQDIYQEAIVEVMDNAKEIIFVQSSKDEFRVIINRRPLKEKKEGD